MTEPTSERSWLKQIRRTFDWMWWPAAAIAFGWTTLATGLSLSVPVLVAFEPLAATVMVLVVVPVASLYTLVHITDTAFGAN